MACAPFVSRLNEIPVAPYGNAWKLEVKDGKNKTLISETFSRGVRSQRVELSEFETLPNGLKVVPTSKLVNFQSDQLTLPNVNLVYSGEISEIKSATLTGVALFVTAAEAYKASEIKTLYVYPNNKKGIYDQVGCAFSKLDSSQISFTGFAFTSQPATNQLPIGAYMPAEFTRAGVCTLGKILANN
jgi:hypothetical protein